MADLADKLNYVKTQIFTNFSSDVTQSWVLSIVKYDIRIFVLHSRGGKLQPTTDMMELEFTPGAFIGPSSKRGLEVAGEKYKLLRAMRFTPPLPSLASPTHAANPPPLVVLHIFLVRSPLPLPHINHGWQEAEYVRWDAWDLIEAALFGKEGEFVELARRVLRQARGE
ncbi:hypothetical protein BDR03DRAFT_976338 [Suillus americanus]|nr:hypothetical protein BDR03DRAFT_976338 [Suillus americanus]